MSNLISTIAFGARRSGVSLTRAHRKITTSTISFHAKLVIQRGLSSSCGICYNEVETSKIKWSIIDEQQFSRMDKEGIDLFCSSAQRRKSIPVEIIETRVYQPPLELSRLEMHQIMSSALRIPRRSRSTIIPISTSTNSTIITMYKFPGLNCADTPLPLRHYNTIWHTQSHLNYRTH